MRGIGAIALYFNPVRICICNYCLMVNLKGKWVNPLKFGENKWVGIIKFFNIHSAFL